jgi:hypothetical protein
MTHRFLGCNAIPAPTIATSAESAASSFGNAVAGAVAVQHDSGLPGSLTVMEDLQGKAKKDVYGTARCPVPRFEGKTKTVIGCPLLVLSRHAPGDDECPLLGAKRTSLIPLINVR